MATPINTSASTSASVSVLASGVAGELSLVGVEVPPAGMQHPPGINHQQPLWIKAQPDQEVTGGHPRRPGAQDHHLHVLKTPPAQLGGVDETRPGNDGGAVLIIVKDRDVEPVSQHLFYIEAVRCTDVLQVDPPHRRRQQFAEPDDVVGVLGVDLQVIDVDVGEPLEENALSLHDRLGGKAPDVAQSQHGRAVGDHRHQVAPVGVLEDIPRILVNRQAGLGHPGGVSQTQVGLSQGRLGGAHLQLPRPGMGVVAESLTEPRHAAILWGSYRSW